MSLHYFWIEVLKFLCPDMFDEFGLTVEEPCRLSIRGQKRAELYVTIQKTGNDVRTVVPYAMDAGIAVGARGIGQ